MYCKDKMNIVPVCPYYFTDKLFLEKGYLCFIVTYFCASMFYVNIKFNVVVVFKNYIKHRQL